MIVVDASALVDALAGNAAVLQRLSDDEIHAPHLIDLEVASALRRLAAGGAIAGPEAATLLRAVVIAAIHRHAHWPLLDVIWSLRDRITPYDAAYVSLAAVLDAPLVTTDRTLAASPGLPCAVELL